MAKDPVCGMFVEERPESIRYTVNDKEYFFCSTQCLNEFREPEKELNKLKIHVAVSIALTIPIIFLSLPHMLPAQFGHILPMDLMHNSSYIMLVLATPLQFWVGWRFYKGFWDGIKAKASNMDTLIAIGTSAAYLYSAAVTLAPNFFPFKSVAPIIDFGKIENSIPISELQAVDRTLNCKLWTEPSIRRK